MGYYTSYELENDAKEGEYTIIERFRGMYPEVERAITSYGNSLNEVKWYGHKEDLTNFSKHYPNVLFTLTGSGEENGDYWKLYVKNGKSQYVKGKITYPEYDESKLEEFA